MLPIGTDSWSFLSHAMRHKRLMSGFQVRPRNYLNMYSYPEPPQQMWGPPGCISQILQTSKQVLKSGASPAKVGPCGVHFTNIANIRKCTHTRDFPHKCGSLRAALHKHRKHLNMYSYPEPPPQKWGAPGCTSQTSQISKHVLIPGASPTKVGPSGLHFTNIANI